MIVQNSVLTSADSVAVFAQATKDDHKSSDAKINALWLKGAVYSFAIAAIAMFFGLVVVFSIWSQHLYISDSPYGNLSTTLMLASFALFFSGAYCLDKAYEPIYKKASLRRTKKGGFSK